MKKNNLFLIVVLIGLASPNLAFAGEWDKARDLSVDKQLADMSAASAILPPGKHENSNLNPKQGTIPGLGLSDAGATAKENRTGIAETNIGAANPNSENPVVNTGSDTGGGANENNVSGGNENFLDANLSVDADESISAEVDTTVTEETPTVGVDVSGEENYLINADATVGDTTVSADLIPSDSLDDTLLGEAVDVGAEVDASGDLSGSEADIGIEADVDGSVSGDDIGDDPADGLSSTLSSATSL